jgi:hypothetical protein
LVGWLRGTVVELLHVRNGSAGSGVKTVLKVALRVAMSLAGAMALSGAQAQPQTEWSKKVEIGDTLIGISKRFLREPLQWRDLQKHNAVRNADRHCAGLDHPHPRAMDARRGHHGLGGSRAGRSHGAVRRWRRCSASACR